jgi:hypothetical protein
MIAAVSFFTGAEIYLSAKILSILCLAVILALFYFHRGENAWLYSLITLNFGFLTIFWNTWSEQPFIAALVYFAFSVSDACKADKFTPKTFANLVISALLLFLTRYIGAFSVLILGFLCVRYFFPTKSLNLEKVKTALGFFACAAFTTLAAAAYFYMNYRMAGIFSISRPPPLKSATVLWEQLYNASVSEVRNVCAVFFKLPDFSCILVLIVFAAGLLFYFFNSLLKNEKRIFHASGDVLSFWGIGAVYFAVFCAIRFTNEMDVFSFRFLAPATILFSMGCASLVREKCENTIRCLSRGKGKCVLLLIIAASVLPYYPALLPPSVRTHVWRDAKDCYSDIKARVLDDLKAVPPNSYIVLPWNTEEGYAAFLRPDLKCATPAAYFPPKMNGEPIYYYEKRRLRTSAHPSVYKGFSDLWGRGEFRNPSNLVKISHHWTNYCVEKDTRWEIGGFAFSSKEKSSPDAYFLLEKEGGAWIEIPMSQITRMETLELPKVAKDENAKHARYRLFVEKKKIKNNSPHCVVAYFHKQKKIYLVPVTPNIKTLFLRHSSTETGH